jgi:hypothetical protein
VPKAESLRLPAKRRGRDWTTRLLHGSGRREGERGSTEKKSRCTSCHDITLPFPSIPTPPAISLCRLGRNRSQYALITQSSIGRPPRHVFQRRTFCDLPQILRDPVCLHWAATTLRLTNCPIIDQDPKEEECQEGYSVLSDGVRRVRHW